MMDHIFAKLLIPLSLIVAGLTVHALEAPKPWTYDAGPDLTTEMGRELVELNAQIPNFAGLSVELTGDQKFRPAFGPISWRMLQEPNSIKILFIGQDGTHIAEAAGRPATASFGGRAHDMANYLGVSYSVAFINTFAFTIEGQYGDRGAPLLYRHDDGEEELCFAGERCGNSFLGSYMTPGLWQLSQGLDSPLVIWRNKLIDWIIRNNRESLKLIVTFGGSARDSISTYVKSKANGDVDTRVSWDEMRKMKTVAYRTVSAGGNNVFPVPITPTGEDLYQRLSPVTSLFAGENAYCVDGNGHRVRRPIYKVKFRDTDCDDDQKLLQGALKRNLQQVKGDLTIIDGGENNSGMIHPGQLGGYSVDTLKVNGRYSASLKGLQLDDGTEIENDVLVVDLPHPTFLSMQSKAAASEAVANSLRVVDEFRAQQSGAKWSIAPDEGLESGFFNSPREPFVYGRADIGPEFYDFGTPKNRMVSESHAKRIGFQAILLGARQDDFFDRGKDDGSEANLMIEELWRQAPNAYPAQSQYENGLIEMYIAQSRTKEERYNFDPGPGEKFARLMKENLNLEVLFENYPGQRWGYFTRKNRERVWVNEDGISASRVKSHPEVGDFGHYRGTFNKPAVVVLADPQGYDDIITARALTGLRGQYLQGLMNDLGVYDNHLVIKTVPFAMDGATAADWDYVLKHSKTYRDRLLVEVLLQPEVQVVLADGPAAEKSLRQFMLDNPALAQEVDVVFVERSEDQAGYGHDMENAGLEMAKLEPFTGSVPQGRPANIPGSHLSYYARVWEGTTGDRVQTSPWDQQGIAFIEVVPKWVTDQEHTLLPQSQKAVDLINQEICEAGLPVGEEMYCSYSGKCNLTQFFARKHKEDFPSCEKF